MKDYVRKADGSDSEHFKHEKDDDWVTVHEYRTTFEYQSEEDHSDRHLCERCDEPGKPVNTVTQAHHTHHLRI